MSQSKEKNQSKGQETIGDVIASLKKGKILLLFGVVVFFVFPFIPPYFLYYDSVVLFNFVFDPRDTSQLPYFFAYLGIYYFIYLIVIGVITEKHKKRQKLIIDKGILLGCPVEISRIKNSTSYQCKVLVNKEMKEKLVSLRLQDKPEWQEEEIARGKPYVLKYSLGGGTSEKFLSKNIPYFEKARMIGLPESLQKKREKLEKADKKAEKKEERKAEKVAEREAEKEKEELEKEEKVETLSTEETTSVTEETTEELENLEEKESEEEKP